MLNSLSDQQSVLAGTSVVAQRLRHQVQRAGRFYRSALLVGEPGSLHEQVARALWACSPLGDRGFQVCQASMLQDNAFTLTGPTTMYLETIEGLSPEQQAWILLRLRERFRSGQAELRLICSSAVSPRGLLAAGRLHPDLYSFLSAVEIRIAPLRERLDDLPIWLKGVDLHPEAMDLLRRHHWPGNFQELLEVLEHSTAAARGETILPEHLPALAGPRPCDQADLKLDSVLRKHVHSVLESCAGNKLKAAETLGISRSTLYRMLEANQG